MIEFYKINPNFSEEILISFLYQVTLGLKNIKEFLILEQRSQTLKISLNLKWNIFDCDYKICKFKP